MDFQRVRSDALQSNTNSAPSHRSNQQMKHALCVFVKGLFTDLSVAPFIILCTGANTPFAQIWFEQWTQTPNHSHIVVNCALFLFSFNTLSIFGQRFREIASLDHWQHTHTQSKFRAAMSYGLCYIWWSQYYKMLIFKLCLHEFAKQNNENRLESYVEEWQEVPKYEPFSNILFIWFY